MYNLCPRCLETVNLTDVVRCPTCARSDQPHTICPPPPAEGKCALCHYDIEDLKSDPEAITVSVLIYSPLATRPASFSFEVDSRCSLTVRPVGNQDMFSISVAGLKGKVKCVSVDDKLRVTQGADGNYDTAFDRNQKYSSGQSVGTILLLQQDGTGAVIQLVLGSNELTITGKLI